MDKFSRMLVGQTSSKLSQQMFLGVSASALKSSVSFALDGDIASCKNALILNSTKISSMGWPSSFPGH